MNRDDFALELPVGSLWLNAQWERDGKIELIVVCAHIKKPNDNHFWFKYYSNFEGGHTFNDLIRDSRDLNGWKKIFVRLDLGGDEHGETHNAGVVRQSELTP